MTKTVVANPHNGTAPAGLDSPAPAPTPHAAARRPHDGAAHGAPGLHLCAADFLVESSLWVSLAAVSLGVWMSLAGGGAVDGFRLAALFTFIFQIYTLDRYLAPPEDHTEHVEMPDPAAFVRQHKGTFRAVLIASAALHVVLVAIKPVLLLSIAISISATAFYMVRVPGLGIRLKQVPFFKNVYAPGVFMAIICAFLGIAPSRQNALMLGAVFLLLFINAIGFDMKDVENDRRVGLRLISTVAAPRTVYGLLAGSAIACTILCFAVLPAPWKAGAAASFLAAGVWILRLARRFSRRVVFVWGDALLMVPVLVTVAMHGGAG